ncbi:UDP-glucose 4-epimerase [Vibrio sp. JCM 19236]|nr:UDP-glucose 4-epimerase [Vibrio sp. JCM 19236]
MNKYLITGANGFVGSTLMSKLGDQATGAVRTAQSTSLENTKVIGDINSTTNWDACLENVDTVVHLAGIASKSGYSSADYDEINHKATIKLAQDAMNLGVRRFIFISTIAVMGLSGSFDEESGTNPQNDYAKSKLDAEHGLRKLLADSEMELVIIRPTLVYGKGATGNFALLQKLIDRLPLLPFRLTKNKRSFISCENLADLIIKCATHADAAGEVFLASEGPGISTKDFTNAIAKGLDRSPIQAPFPSSLAKVLFALVKRPSMYSQLFEDLEVRSTKLQDTIGWTAPLSMQQNMAKLKEIK